jgi:hypothetical protein
VDTIADKVLDGTWQDAYALTSISVGTPLVIQNKSTSGLLVYLAAAAPLASATDGFYVGRNLSCDVAGGESGCWVKGMGRTSIQNGS